MLEKKTKQPSIEIYFQLLTHPHPSLPPSENKWPFATPFCLDSPNIKTKFSALQQISYSAVCCYKIQTEDPTFHMNSVNEIKEKIEYDLERNPTIREKK